MILGLNAINKYKTQLLLITKFQKYFINFTFVDDHFTEK